MIDNFSLLVLLLVNSLKVLSFLLPVLISSFPVHAVSNPVILKCTRVRHKDILVKPRNGDAFCSKIMKMEPVGVSFDKPVTVLFSHSAAEHGANADYCTQIDNRS